MKHASILINGRYACAPATGVQRYARNVVARLDTPARMIAPHRNPGRLGGLLWEQVLLPRRVEAGELLWSPANTGPLSVRAQVVTIHDLAAIEHPEWFAAGFAAWYGWLLPRLARRARRVLTVSRFSKDRLQAVLHLPSEKIVIAPPGVGPEFYSSPQEAIEAVRRKYRLAATYFLWVGTLEPRKNLPGLLRAWQMSRPTCRDAELILCGAGQRIFKRVDLNSLPDGVRALGTVAEADLPPLYSGAVALLLPSFYEGFGLPALEAMACGTAAIVSESAGICREVQAGMLPVDAQAPESIAAAITRLYEDAGLRRTLGEQGRAAAAGFHWERAAAITRETLQLAAEEID